MAQVYAFQIDYARIRAQFFMKQIFAHIYCIYAACAVRQQAICKAASGSSGIHANLALKLQGISLENGEQLFRAAAGPGLARQQLKTGARGKELAWLRHFFRLKLAGHKRYAPGHDKACGHGDIFRQALFKDQLVSADFAGQISINHAIGHNFRAMEEKLHPAVDSLAFLGNAGLEWARVAIGHAAHARGLDAVIRQEMQDRG